MRKAIDFKLSIFWVDASVSEMCFFGIYTVEFHRGCSPVISEENATSFTKIHSESHAEPNGSSCLLEK